MLLALVATVVGCTPPPEPAAPLTTAGAPADGRDGDVIDVRTALPAPLQPGRRKPLIGRVEAGEELPLAFLAAGVVDAVRVDIGDRVRKGQVLASLQATDLDAAAVSARTQSRLAEQQLARFQQLYQQRYVSLHELDSARSTAAVAEQELRRAAHLQRYARIVAPADGIVLARQVRPGEIVSQGQTVLTVAGLDKGWLVRAEVPDRDVAALAIDAPVQIALDAAPGAALDGRVSRIAGAASASSGTVALEIRILTPHAALRSGMIARVALPATVPATPRLSVPMSALIDVEGTQAALFVVREGRAQRSAVAIGELADGRVEISSGLRADDRVVIGGASYVVDRARVRESVL
ncbi:efflux RND transporter periplasmic adaptor subunit [Xanthomonas sp. NCPPB 3005]|jgi:RND family efflux transporter MFP subunit|uniref:efflux RND transporter periplasmic adaptor subunit n=1 Tax=Xanthomonas sp. NCPPB 3005 TaxID=3240913 RepID=UPI003519D3CF